MPTPPLLARVLSTRASLEHALGHLDAAAEFERTALRLRLAGALVFQLTGMTHAQTRTQRALATELRQDSRAGTGLLPSTLAEVIRVAERTDGVRLGELIAALAPAAKPPRPPWPTSSAPPVVLHRNRSACPRRHVGNMDSVVHDPQHRGDGS
jgi:hypothetical protein